jgi:N-acetylated-alpha-linked acidic dipeptidase
MRMRTPLLAALAGPWLRGEWRGRVPITVPRGAGAGEGAFEDVSNWDIKPVYDVIAKIPGSVAPDEWVIRGNHHDAWVNGAEDPISAGCG